MIVTLEMAIYRPIAALMQFRLIKRLSVSILGADQLCSLSHPAEAMSHFISAASLRCPTKSAFTITSREAHAIMSSWHVTCKQALLDGNNNNGQDSDLLPLACYLMHVAVKSVYSDSQVPQSCYKKIPRLINGIPLGAGKLTKAQSENIQWRFIEGTTSFLSIPVRREDAEESRKRLRDNLIQYGRQVFGDLTVKLNIVLTECIKYDEEIFINDIAYSSDEGLHFTD